MEFLRQRELLQRLDIYVYSLSAVPDDVVLELAPPLENITRKRLQRKTVEHLPHLDLSFSAVALSKQPACRLSRELNAEIGVADWGTRKQKTSTSASLDQRSEGEPACSIDSLAGKRGRKVLLWRQTIPFVPVCVSQMDHANAGKF